MDASKRFYALEHMEGAPSHPVSIPVSILLGPMMSTPGAALAGFLPSWRARELLWRVPSRLGPRKSAPKIAAKIRNKVQHMAEGVRRGVRAAGAGDARDFERRKHRVFATQSECRLAAASVENGQGALMRHAANDNGLGARAWEGVSRAIAGGGGSNAHPRAPSGTGRCTRPRGPTPCRRGESGAADWSRGRRGVTRGRCWRGRGGRGERARGQRGRGCRAGDARLRSRSLGAAARGAAVRVGSGVLAGQRDGRGGDEEREEEGKNDDGPRDAAHRCRRTRHGRTRLVELIGVGTWSGPGGGGPGARSVCGCYSGATCLFRDGDGKKETAHERHSLVPRPPRDVRPVPGG